MRKRIAIIALATVFVLLAGCSRHNYRRYIEYLKAERQLRAAAQDQQELEKQIIELQRESRIDPDKELARFFDHEKLWVEFLMDLSRAQ